MHERRKKVHGSRSKAASSHSSAEDITNESAVPKKPLKAKWKPGVKLQVACSESEGNFFLQHFLNKCNLIYLIFNFRSNYCYY